MSREQDEAARSADAYYESIEEEWQQLTGRMITPDDYRVMQAIRLDGVPLDVVQSTLREQVAKRGRRRPLAYHRPAILEAWRMQRRLMAPGAGSVSEDGPVGQWAQLGLSVHRVVDGMVSGGRAGDEAMCLIDLAYSGPLTEVEDENLAAAWVEWKREAAELAVREGIETGIVGEIIRRVEA